MSQVKHHNRTELEEAQHQARQARKAYWTARQEGKTCTELIYLMTEYEDKLIIMCNLKKGY